MSSSQCVVVCRHLIVSLNVVISLCRYMSSFCVFQARRRLRSMTTSTNPPSTTKNTPPLTTRRMVSPESQSHLLSYILNYRGMSETTIEVHSLQCHHLDFHWYSFILRWPSIPPRKWFRWQRTGRRCIRYGTKEEDASSIFLKITLGKSRSTTWSLLNEERVGRDVLVFWCTTKCILSPCSDVRLPNHPGRPSLLSELCVRAISWMLLLHQQWPRSPLRFAKEHRPRGGLQRLHRKETAQYRHFQTWYPWNYQFHRLAHSRDWQAKARSVSKTWLKMKSGRG